MVIALTTNGQLLGQLFYQPSVYRPINNKLLVISIGFRYPLCHPQAVAVTVLLLCGLKAVLRLDKFTRPAVHTGDGEVWRPGARASGR